MTMQAGIGQALAELVRRLTLEEKREFARWLRWDELDTLRNQGPVPDPSRRVGEPRVYVGATSDGLALELPVECAGGFVKRLPAILCASSVEMYLRRNGRGQEHQVHSEEWAAFLESYQDVLVEGGLMIEVDGATLVSGGGGCMFLTLEGISGEVRRRLAREALRACGFEYVFKGDRFTATVWDDELEVSDR